MLVTTDTHERRIASPDDPPTNQNAYPHERARTRPGHRPQPRGDTQRKSPRGATQDNARQHEGTDPWYERGSAHARTTPPEVFETR